jgi:ferric-dicitrate binding protein FerR (iron transport regulator)
MKFNREAEEKIKKYVDGTAIPDEVGEVRAMFINGESDDGLRKILEEDWNALNKNDIRSDRDLKPLLDRIHHQIRLGDFRKGKGLTRKLTGLYARVAAILLLPLIIAGGYLLYRSAEINGSPAAITSIYAPQGSRVSFTLPDGTSGMLNSGSTLSYSLPFTTKRDVSLTGEAWFEVKHDEKHPFDVMAGNVNLTVLGTSFNVSAYPEENYIEVVLESGQVMLKSPAFEGDIIMRPSECFLLENGKMSRNITDPSKYSSWTEGKLVFRSDSMSEVARRIERWYNVRVELMDSELENYSFRATFEDDPLEEVLKFLSMTSPIRYEITPRSLNSDSTYTKSIVKIYLR